MKRGLHIWSGIGVGTSGRRETWEVRGVCRREVQDVDGGQLVDVTEGLLCLGSDLRDPSPPYRR